jgi:tetratricopeptide (TPR) repeat protein
MSRSATFTSRVALLALLTPLWAATAAAQVRAVEVGDALAPFTLPDLDGEAFTYSAPRERAAMLVFLAPHQKRSERAVDDLRTLAAGSRRDGHPIDLLLVVSGGEGVEHFRSMRDAWGPTATATMLVDAGDVLWGRLGVVVTPTTFLIDDKGRIGWIRAGHSYDYAAEARARLGEALGTAPPPAATDGAPAPAEDLELRAGRHLRLGRMLARRGEIEPGIGELRKADTLVPGAATIRLELARLLCRAGHPEEALEVAASVEPVTPAARAEAATVAGCAHGQLGDLDEALAQLTDALAIDPESSRTLYELGRVHEARGDCEKAMDAYRRALAAQYGDDPEPATDR